MSTTDFIARIGSISDNYSRNRDALDGRLYAVYSALTGWPTAPTDLVSGYALAEDANGKGIWIVKVVDGGPVYAFNTNRSVRVVLHDGTERIAVPAPLPFLRELHRDQESIVDAITTRFTTETTET
ncbi:MAG: hypothetical protein ACLQPV_01230 [Vulcanimicrobiaceae bacterium]